MTTGPTIPPDYDPFSDMFLSPEPHVVAPPLLPETTSGLRTILTSLERRWPLTRRGTAAVMAGLVALTALGVGLSGGGDDGYNGSPLVPGTERERISPGLTHGSHLETTTTVEHRQKKEVIQQSTPFDFIDAISDVDQARATHLIAALVNGQKWSEEESGFMDKYYKTAGKGNTEKRLTQIAIKENQAEFVTALQLRSGLKVNFYQSRFKGEQGKFTIDPEGVDALVTRVFEHMDDVQQSYLTSEQVMTLQLKAATGGYDNELVTVILSNNSLLCSTDRDGTPLGYAYDSDGKCQVAGTTQFMRGNNNLYHNINPMVLIAAANQNAVGGAIGILGHELGHAVILHDETRVAQEEAMMYAIQDRLALDYAGANPPAAPFRYAA